MRAINTYHLRDSGRHATYVAIEGSGSPVVRNVQVQFRDAFIRKYGAHIAISSHARSLFILQHCCPFRSPGVLKIAWQQTVCLLDTACYGNTIIANLLLSDL